jgi:hypothetical protein
MMRLVRVPSDPASGSPVTLVSLLVRGLSRPEVTMTSYRANVRLSFADKDFAEGDIIDDIPTKSLKWVIEQGLVVAVEAKKGTKPIPVTEPSED